jgi:hypothetical protein
VRRSHAGAGLVRRKARVRWQMVASAESPVPPIASKGSLSPRQRTFANGSRQTVYGRHLPDAKDRDRPIAETRPTSSNIGCTVDTSRSAL